MVDKKVSTYVKEHYGEKDLNCSETILYAANEVHNLGLDEAEMGDINCEPLKDEYFSEEGCYEVILTGAEVLDIVIDQNI